MSSRHERLSTRCQHKPISYNETRTFGPPEIEMAQFVVRDIDEAVSRRFFERARREGKSAEELARELITRHANETREKAARRLEEIRLSTVGAKTSDPVELIRADRDGDHAG